MSGDIHALSGAYAVDALDDIERAQFTRHLEDCDSCRAEVDGLRETANLMQLTPLTPPPAALRDRVLSAVETVRPLPPVATTVQAHARTGRRRLAVLVAAAAALIAVGFGGAQIVGPDNSGQQVASASQRVQDAPDAQQFQQALRSGGSVTVLRSKSLNQAMITTDGLPRLAENQTYELWLDHDGTKVKAGLIDGDATHVLLDGDPATATGVAITLEKQGGVDEPRGPLVTQIGFDQA